MDEKVSKIAVNPFSHHSFICIGKNYIRGFSFSDKAFKESKEPILPLKYEKDNHFTDIKFLPDSHTFILVSGERNIFVVDGRSVVFVRFEQSANIFAELTTKTDILEIDSEKANKEVEAEIEAQRGIFETHKDQHMELIVSTHK